jgi:hypothetical protein
VGSDPITDQIPDPPSIDAQASRGVPSDNTTLTEVLERYDASGYRGQFGVTDEIDVRCFTCRNTMPPNEVELVSLRRMEGASDPDDMLAIAAMRCPRCGAQGTITLGYGPDSAAEEAELLLRLEDLRGSAEGDEVPPNAAPGETAEEIGGGR